MSDKKIEKGIFKGLTVGSLKDTTPGWSATYSVFAGESHHKKNIKSIFNELPNPEPVINVEEEPVKVKRRRNKKNIEPIEIKEIKIDQYPDNSNWRDRQIDLEEQIAESAPKGKFLDAKVRNDVYVAGIMKDQQIMREAARFCMDMSNMYGKDGDRADQIKGLTGEMYHMWPNQDTDKTKNTKYRNYKEPAKSFLYYKMEPTFLKKLRNGVTDDNYLSNAMEANKKTLERLINKKKPYNLEESMYILRAMGQLRDVMKCEKKKEGLIPKFLSESLDDEKPRINRIRVKGKAPKKTEGRNNPPEHNTSRYGINRFLQPIGTLYHKKC